MLISAAVALSAGYLEFGQRLRERRPMCSGVVDKFSDWADDPSMRSKIVASLLIFGWVLLSGVDLVEDLDEISGHGAISSAASPDSVKSKRVGWGALANNIVESGARLPQVFGELSSLTTVFFDLETYFEFRRHFRLHKLYRVFLI